MARHDVVVVGGGAVGAAVALALSRQGLDVALVERGPPAAAFDAQAYDARVYALSPGSVAFLEELGAWGRIAARRVSPCTRMVIWESRADGALTFDAAELSVPELGSIVEDGLLRAALWESLGAVRVHHGTEPVTFRHEAGVSSLELSDGTALEAPLVVGAEGAGSRLREWAGIEPVEWRYPQRAVVCHVRTRTPHRGTAWQRFLRNGPLALLPLADGRSSIVWSTLESEAAVLLALGDRAFCTRVSKALDGEPAPVTAATPRSAFPVRLLHAQDYVRPGLALVGDSAHVIHPLAGQGINLGFADARALAGVLAQAKAEARAFGGLRLLQRYQRRRKADNLEMMAMTDALYRAWALDHPVWNPLRRFGLAAVEALPPLKRRLAQRAMGLPRET